MDMSKTGKLIAELRKKMNLTQEDLGQRLNVSAKAVSKWERGLSHPDVALIGRLAAELRISIVELLSGEINKHQDNPCYTVANTDAKSSVYRSDTSSLTIKPDPAASTIVSPFLFGENLEHTRSNVFMGLSAQMLRNRKFAGKPRACCGCAAEWYPIGENVFYAQCASYTRHHDELYHMKRLNECYAQRIVNLYGGESGMGQHELAFIAGTQYECRIVAKSLSDIDLKISLTGHNSKTVYAENSVTISAREWTIYEMVLTCPQTDYDGDLRIVFEGCGTLEIGAVSLMPAGHFRGMRRDVINCLREMGVKMLRWPGGNFAGEYCWGDGLLPVDMRAPLESYQALETQGHSMCYDYHEIDTDDFIALCREVGAEPYITINPTWNTPEENAAWVEYCNGSKDTKFGAMRAERGHEEPYCVQFWSLGNEAGYGHMEGDNTPYGYGQVAKKHALKMLEVSGRLSLCSSGPYPNRDWAEYAAKPLSGFAQLVSQHYYSPSPTYADPAKLEEEYYACIGSPEHVRNKIREMRSHLSENLQISFDEWNTWYAWFRPSSMVDGLFSAQMLHMFIGEAEPSGIALVCHFEAINEGMMIVRPEGTKLTAAGQAFAMMQHHAGGLLQFTTPDCAATLKDGVLTVTAVNPSYDQPREIIIASDGELAGAQLYTCDRVAPFTYFDIHPTAPVREADGWKIQLPPHSMLLVQLHVL